MQINFNLRDNCHILQTTFTRLLTDQQKKVIIVVSAIFGLLAVFFIINLWRKVISLKEQLKEIKIGKNDPEKKEERVEKKEQLIIKNNEILKNTQILDDQLNPSLQEPQKSASPTNVHKEVEALLKVRIGAMDEIIAAIDFELISLGERKEFLNLFKKMTDNNQETNLLTIQKIRNIINDSKIKKVGEELIPLEDGLKRLEEDKKSLHENQSKLFEKILKGREDREHEVQNKLTLALECKNSLIALEKAFNENQSDIGEKLKEFKDKFAELKNKYPK